MDGPHCGVQGTDLVVVEVLSQSPTSHQMAAYYLENNVVNIQLILTCIIIHVFVHCRKGHMVLYYHCVYTHVIANYMHQ